MYNERYNKFAMKAASQMPEKYLQKIQNMPSVPMPVKAKDDENPATFYKNGYGGRLPIGSIRLEKREKRKRRLKYVTKLLFMGGALGLILISVLRFTAAGALGVHTAIMNAYYLFFGVVAALTQLNVEGVSNAFRFLNYYWGKGLFSLFLASLSISNSKDQFIQWVLTIYFFVCASLMFILAVLDRERDREQAKIDRKIIKQLEVEEDEGGIAFEVIPFAK